MPRPFKASSHLTLAACAALLALFTVTSWLAVRTESPTFDEPYHALSAWTQLHLLDFRIDCEDPPLWKYWAALPNGRGALSANFAAENWRDQPQKMWEQWSWTVQTLYHTPGNNAEAFIMRSRAMMLFFAVGLGASISWWSWRIGGAVAAIVATALFCFDPNFLAHAPLVKNDVVFSLTMLGLLFALWRAGQKFTWTRVLYIAILCGVMLTTKFSGVIALMLVPLLLGIRAFLPQPWPALGRVRNSHFAKLIIAGDITLISLLISFAIIWLAYGLRFSPTPNPNVHLNLLELEQMATNNELIVQHGGQQPTPEDFATVQPGLLIREIMAMQQYHVLPEAWLAGFLFTYQSALLRISFLCGHISRMGWWWYFPFAMLVKTPLTTLTAAIAAGGIAIFALKNHRGDPWTILCLTIPAALYTALAMHSDLNIGIRHMLPVYPLAYIAMGSVAGFAWRRWRSRALWPMGTILFLLAIESQSVFPNFIPYFNLAAGGSRGGIRLLGDSNLDWGQNLKLLKKWQDAHPDTPLYLSYFGLVDPHYYGIQYISQPGSYDPAHPGSRHAVIAVSATHLQGLFVDKERYQKFYAPLAKRTPIEVLGGSLYLYSYP